MGATSNSTLNSLFSVRLLKNLKLYQWEYERSLFSTLPLQISGRRLIFREDDIRCARKYFMVNFKLSSGYEVLLDRESDESPEESSYESGTKMLKLRQRLLEHDLGRLSN